MPKRVALPPGLLNFTVAEGRAAGVGDKRMRSADLESPFHGVRSTVRTPDATGPRDAVALLCASYSPLLASNQFFSHVTAALLWDCPLPRTFELPSPLHVSTFAPARAVRRVGVVGHRTGHASVAVRHGFRVADPVTLFCELATVLSSDDLVAVADHLVLDPRVLDPHDIRPYVLPVELAAGVRSFTGRGCRAAASVVQQARRGAESRPETLLRLLLGRAGFPEPEVNPDLFSEDGRWLARVDLLYREWKVVVEYDGDQHRISTAQYEADIARTERMERAGWIVLKVRARGLTVSRADTVERVRRALTGRGWRP